MNRERQSGVEAFYDTDTVMSFLLSGFAKDKIIALIGNWKNPPPAIWGSTTRRLIKNHDPVGTNVRTPCYIDEGYHSRRFSLLRCGLFTT